VKTGSTSSPPGPHPSRSFPYHAELFALVFGAFLGLCVWKFGNPVILDQKIVTPANGTDFLHDAWPTHWTHWILTPLAIWGFFLAWRGFRARGSGTVSSKLLWVLPLAWLGWQAVSASRTVDWDLTGATLWQFAGCVICYFLGTWLLGREKLTQWLLIGLLAAFAYCLVRAVDQHVFEFPESSRELTEGQRTGWTNMPAASFDELKSEGIIITTNGVDAVNPVIMAKFAKGRVSGTLVYPNALAQLILLLWPVSLVFAFGATRRLKPLVRWAAIAMTLFLGAAAFFWSGSKFGWLIAIGLAGLALLRMDWPARLKWAAVVTVVVLGLGVFAVRFHHYFAAGATSAGARFDYWRAAVQTTVAHPFFGTGPGTFQRPYALIKSPASEMARLAHNDYLEQFSDSGIPGGLAYLAWIGAAFVVAIKKFWPGEIVAQASSPAGSGGVPPPERSRAEGIRSETLRTLAAGTAALQEARQEPPLFAFAILLGLTGWFVQGMGEFGLFVPALAWTAFTLLGCLVGRMQFTEQRTEIPVGHRVASL